MGFIANHIRTKQAAPFGADPSTVLAGNRRRAGDLWHEVFGTNKEDTDRRRSAADVSSTGTNLVAGGSGGRSLSSNASVTRLIEALRSRAPGGWSDDRYEQSRHFHGVVYVAVHRKAMMMSQAEFAVFRKDPRHQDGKRPVEQGDPAYPLVELLEHPNNEDSFGDLMYKWSQQKDLTGTALTWMMPNRLGAPMSLYSIPTAVAIPQPTINPLYPHGFYRIQPLYPYGPFSSTPTPNSAVGACIPAEWMMRFKNHHPLLWYDGYSPLTGMRLHVDEIESVDRSRFYKMKRASNPDAALDFSEMEGAQPLSEAEVDRLRSQFEADFQGPENAGRLFIPPPGSKLEPWGTSPRDMDYPNGWDQLLNFILGGFGITKPAAGMVEDSSYATLFATLKQLDLVTLDPDRNYIANKLTRFLAPFFGDDLIIEIRGKRIDDHDIKDKRISQLMAAKAITKNEVRKEYDVEITREEWGEEIAGTEAPQENAQQMLQAAAEPTEEAGLEGRGPLAGIMANNRRKPGEGGSEDEARKEQQAEQRAQNPQDGKPMEPIEPKEPGDDLEEQQLRGPRPGNLGRGALGPRKDLLSALRAKYHRNGQVKAGTR